MRSRVTREENSESVSIPLIRKGDPEIGARVCDGGRGNRAERAVAERALSISSTGGRPPTVRLSFHRLRLVVAKGLHFGELHAPVDVDRDNRPMPEDRPGGEPDHHVCAYAMIRPHRGFGHESTRFRNLSMLARS